MMLEIRWHGRGGQGAITVSKVLAMAALKEDLFVQSFPEYGPERSGAPIKAYNRISDREIFLHSGVYQPDRVAVLDRTLLATEDVTEGLTPEGALVVNTPDGPEAVRERTGYPGQILTVAADGIAEETNRFPNVPLLGALLTTIEPVPPENVEEALRERLSEKLSPEIVDLNVEALRRGQREAARLDGQRGASRPQQGAAGAKGAQAGRLRGYRELPVGGVITREIREEHITGGWRQKKPVVDEALCVNCLLCWVNCPEPAIVIQGGQMRGYDYNYCKGCGICSESCPTGAITMIAEAESAPPMGRYRGEEAISAKGERGGQGA